MPLLLRSRDLAANSGDSTVREPISDTLTGVQAATAFLENGDNGILAFTRRSVAIEGQLGDRSHVDS